MPTNPEDTVGAYHTNDVGQQVFVKPTRGRWKVDEVTGEIVDATQDKLDELARVAMMERVMRALPPAPKIVKVGNG